MATTLLCRALQHRGTPKLVTIALAERAKQFHEKGSPSKSIFTPGLPLTTSLTVRFLVRRPSTSVRLIKARLTPAKLLTTEKYPYFDPHLSTWSQDLRYGFCGDIDVAIIEVTEMNPSGEVILGAGIGMSPTIAKLAKRS